MDRLFLMCLLDALKAKQPTGNACKESRETCVQIRLRLIVLTIADSFCL